MQRGKGVEKQMFCVTCDVNEEVKLFSLLCKKIIIIIISGIILIFCLTSCSVENSKNDMYEYTKQQSIDIWNIFLKDVATELELTNVKIAKDAKDEKVLYICYTCKNANENNNYFVCATNYNENNEWKIVDQYHKSEVGSAEIYEKVLNQINNSGDVLEIPIEEFNSI